MKHNEVFEVREPPPHGLTRLRARLREDQRRRFGRRALVLAGATVAAVLVAVLWPADAANLTPLARDGVTAGLIGLAPAQTSEPLTVLDATQAAAVRLPSSNPDVVIYRVVVLGDQGRPE